MTSAPRSLAAVVLWALALGLIVAWASLSLRFGTRHEAIYNITATLQGKPISMGDLHTDLPFYNRVFFPLLHQGVKRVLPFASDGQVYLLLRILTFQAAFVAFALVCNACLGLPRPITVLATALLGLATITTFNFPWEYPDDAIDILGLALGVGAVLQRRYLWVLGLSIVFAANRESAAFFGIIWFVLHATRQSWLRPGIEGAVVCVLSYATTIGLRLLVGPTFIANYITPAVNLELLLDALSRPNLLGYPAMTVAALVLLMAVTDLRVELVKRFYVLAGLFLVFGLTFGKINEMRVFLSTFVMLSFAVAASFTGRERELPAQ